MIAIMQSAVFSWLGYFDLIKSVDKFVFLDDVQFCKRSWQCRNRVKVLNGEIQYLSIPVNTPDGRDDTLIKDVEFCQNIKWRNDFSNKIKQNYSKADCFNDVWPWFVDMLSYDTNLLSDFNIHFAVTTARKLGYKTKFFKSSEIETKGKKDEKLVGLCLALNENKYLSPQGSSEYIEKEAPGGEFPKNKVLLYYQLFYAIPYKQINGEFVSHLSILDTLFNVGWDRTRQLIEEGHADPYDYMSFREKVLKK